METTVKAIILTRRIYNDFPKSTGLRVPKITILTYSQRSIGQLLYRFLYNDFYFNDRFLLVNSLELALRYLYMAFTVGYTHLITGASFYCYNGGWRVDMASLTVSRTVADT